MAPAQQGLDPDHAAAVGGDDGLVMHLELLAGHGGFEFAEQKPAVDMGGFDCRFELAHGAAAVALGRAQGEVRAPRQFLAGRRVPRRLRDADTGADVPHPLDENRPRQGGAYRFGQRLRRPRTAFHDDGELVFLEAAQQHARRQAGPQMFGDGDQHGVAAAAAERIVDLTKGVEIDQREHHGAAFVGQRLVEPLEHGAVIGEPGQGVLVGEPPHGLGGERERTGEPPRRGGGKDGADRKRNTCGADQEPEPVHGPHQAAIRRPAEPADDAAIVVMERLYLTAAVGGHFGVEAKIAQAGATLDQPQLRRIEPRHTAEYRAHLIEREAQRPVPLGRLAAVLVLGDGVADHRAHDHRAGQDDQEVGREPHGLGTGAIASRRARPRPGTPPQRPPPGPGCRRGRHFRNPNRHQRTAP